MAGASYLERYPPSAGLRGVMPTPPRPPLPPLVISVFDSMGG
ncbi:hypothetical protein [Aneurinibacillus migulanus]|nr:hypothetical protein [Aneurinibacillus migulanus]